MGSVNGLPAHILLVHAIVVLLPLAAVLLVSTAIWPAVRGRLAGPNAVLSLLVVVLVPLTTSAGEWLERRVTDTALLHDHTELGDGAIFAAVPVAMLAVVIWWRNREATAAPSTGDPTGGGTGGGTATLTRQRTYLAPASLTVTRVIAAIAIVVALYAVYDIYRIGDSGAKASWNGNFSTTANPGPGRD
ncbi:MAG: hypothetical protein QOE51_2200 [Actinoplanes sp.]|nr:hypothetical protein [Actinoplanes sp.]